MFNPIHLARALIAMALSHTKASLTRWETQVKLVMDPTTFHIAANNPITFNEAWLEVM